VNLEKWLAGLVWAVISGGASGVLTSLVGGCGINTRTTVLVAVVTGALAGGSYLKDSRPPHDGIDLRRFTAGSPPAHS
jgi:hypothetical protein